MGGRGVNKTRGLKFQTTLLIILSHRLGEQLMLTAQAEQNDVFPIRHQGSDSGGKLDRPIRCHASEGQEVPKWVVSMQLTLLPPNFLCLWL